MNKDDKINEIRDDELGQVSGGQSPMRPPEFFIACPACGNSGEKLREVFRTETDDQYAYLVCKACGHKKINGILG